MIWQYIIVGLVIAAAAAYGVRRLVASRRAFSVKPGCGADCGCGKK